MYKMFLVKKRNLTRSNTGPVFTRISPCEIVYHTDALNN